MSALYEAGSGAAREAYVYPPPRPEPDASLLCNRGAAREARGLARAALDFARCGGVEAAPSCALHPDHDKLLPHEEQKKMLNRHQWRCGICGKTFRSERYLDAHLDRRHLDTLAPNATLCVGDLCDVLRCPGWLRAQRAEHHGACNARALDARRHWCQHVMHDCFADQGAAGHAVFEKLDAHFCEPLSCAWRERLRDGAEIPALRCAGAGDAGGGHAGYYVGAGALCAALVLLYVGIACWYGETKWLGGDLRRSRHRRSIFKTKSY